MVTINTIGVSKEIDGESGVQLTDELTFLSGKYAGTCYAADGYETIRTQEPQKALRRAENTAQNGHHSVFQHSMVTMEIQCPKIIAMLLNSIGVSNTSEKSARYTKMKPQSEKEAILYEKWHDILKQQIEALYPEKFSEREADKLAYENARYMLSVFCPTSMVYSLPFRNIFYVMDWAEQMRDQLNGQADAFSRRLAEELSGLVKSLDVVIGFFMIIKMNIFVSCPCRRPDSWTMIMSSTLEMCIRQNFWLLLHRLHRSKDIVRSV